MYTYEMLLVKAEEKVLQQVGTLLNSFPTLTILMKGHWHLVEEFPWTSSSNARLFRNSFGRTHTAFCKGHSSMGTEFL